MNRQVVIDWRAVLPLNDFAWRDCIDYVIGDLQEEHGRVLRPADHPESHVDLLFVAYLAVDHDRIVQEELLLKCLSKVDANVSSLILAACDKANQGSDVDVDGVRELLINQGHGFGGDQLAFRLPTVELFQDQARACIGRHVRRLSLLRYYDESPEILGENSSTNGLNAFYIPEYL